LFLNKSVVIIKNYHCYNNSGDTVSHNGILNMNIKRMDWPMLYTGNPVVLQPGMVFFMHMILMDSENELAMNLGETYLITPSGNERLGKKKLDLVIG
jgi:Xaa-Pro aminopeptidase